MPIPSDEGVPSLWGLLADLGERDNRRGHIGAGRSVWSVSSIWSIWSIWLVWLVWYNQMNETDRTDQTDQTDEIDQIDQINQTDQFATGMDVDEHGAIPGQSLLVQPT